MTVLATLTLITGIIYRGFKWGWVEGAAIYLAMLIVIVLGSLNDYLKDKQFQKLSAFVKDSVVSAVRGKYGSTMSLNVGDIVVGDLILLEAGQRVPADCVLIEAADVTVDEKYYYGDDAPAKRKQVATANNFEQGPDPFILSQTLIQSGTGIAVVCAVGANSRRGESIKDRLGISDQKTSLEERLQCLTITFTKIGLYSAILVFVAAMTNFGVRLFVFEEGEGLLTA